MKQLKIHFIKATLLDIFLVFYSIIVVQRAIYYRFILDLKEVPFSWSEIGWIFLMSAAVGSTWFLTRTSISGKLFGVAKDGLLTKRIVELFSWFLFNITVIAGWTVTKISLFDLFNKDGMQGAQRIFYSLFRPEFGIFDQALFAVIETIYIALIATLISLPPTFILSFLMARNVMKKNGVSFIIYSTLRIIVNFMRSVEPLVWAIIFSVWVGIGPFAGMLALLVHTVVANAKLCSEAIENIDSGLIEAITATGANGIQIIWYGIVPQVILPFLSFTIYRWDINIRMATVIGVVGGGGIGTLLIQYQGLAKWHEVGLIILVIGLVVSVTDYLSAKIREAVQ